MSKTGMLWWKHVCYNKHSVIRGHPPGVVGCVFAGHW